MTITSVGVLLNPIAGFGGTLALHGSDSLHAGQFEEAVTQDRAGRRLIRSLNRFILTHPNISLVAAPGMLGSDRLLAAGIPHQSPLDWASVHRRTTRMDTIAAARALCDAGVGCIIFSGGDGTATDIAAAIGTEVPVIGVPSGVKMHSEVFARSPEGAGRMLSEFAAGSGETAVVEVLDVGPDDRTTIVGMLRAPRVIEALQRAKASNPLPSDAVVSRAIAREILAETDPRTIWVIGPGTTTGAFAECLGFTATLRGVDVWYPSGAIELDIDETRLFQVVSESEMPHLALGVVGGQGFLLGRGNHEISARVISKVGEERVVIIATERKIGGLIPPVLLVDVGDAMAQHPLVGYRQVRSGARQRTVMRVIDASQ